MKAPWPVFALTAVLGLLLSGCGAVRSKQAERDLNLIADAAHLHLAEYAAFPGLPETAFYATLSGANPRGIILLQIAPGKTDAAGRFLDPWGNFYRVTYPTPRRVTVASAGKDGIRGNSDDLLVTK